MGFWQFMYIYACIYETVTVYFGYFECAIMYRNTRRP